MEYKLAVSSMPVFKNMVQSKCTSWSQKKALLQLMESELERLVKECDDLMMRGQPLTSAQQTFYEECSERTNKQDHVKQALHIDVEAERVTQIELDKLLSHVEARISELKKTSSKKLTAKALERQQKLLALTPMPPPKLEHHAALGKLWKQVQPLQNFNEGGQLLSIQDTKLLGQKLECLERIEELEQASRIRLEDDIVFEARLGACRREFQSKFGSSSGKKNAKSSNKESVVNSSTKIKVATAIKWITPQEKKTAAMAKKKAKQKKGDVFGAMMATYDDSSDASDDDEEEEDGN
jgi:hypothetical protein